MIKTLPKFIAHLQAKGIRVLEKRIGYKLVFPQISETWINAWVRLNLTKQWKKFGLDATGVDYFTMGNLVDGASTRFDPEAKQYQAWLGGYLIKYDRPRKHTIQDHLSLAVVDQLDWLRHYGDPKPVCELHPVGFKKISDVKISGYEGRLYEGGGMSHSDIGPNSQGLRTSLIMAFVATIFNFSNPKLNLISRNFIPKVTLGSYPPVYLKGHIIILEIEEGTHAVLYGTGVVYKDASGKEVDTFKFLQNQISDIQKNVKIEKL